MDRGGAGLDVGRAAAVRSPDDGRAVAAARSPTAATQHLAQLNGAVSLIDSSALVLAELNGWTLLAGDRALRALAERRGIDCHGFLWVSDQLEAANIDKLQLATAIETLMNHRSCRLPKNECTLRIQRLRG